MLNIISDVIRDGIDKHVYVTEFTERAIGQFRKRLASVIAPKGEHIVQHFDVLGTVDML